MLWPTIIDWSKPSASTTAANQSAMASIVSSGTPWLRPCPGRSMAAALNPCRAKYRDIITQMEWSIPAPWTNTMAGAPGWCREVPVDTNTRSAFTSRYIVRFFAIDVTHVLGPRSSRPDLPIRWKVEQGLRQCLRSQALPGSCGDGSYSPGE